uniref:VWFA domain-containing protein n=1 Tax=Oryzias latipes TaxID=8090 RepID=A0A3B3HQW8_ORYLA
ISVVQHSERPAPNFYLNTYKTKEEVLRAINEMTPAGGRSLNTGSALKFMKDTILSEPNGSRSALNVPQFLIVLAADRSVDNVKQPASDLKKEGVVPFGVGVKNADPEQIKTISQNPSLAFTVKEFSELKSILTLLSKTLTRYILKSKDIVFLLDDSDNTKDGFSAIKHFVKNIVETLYVRIALALYSNKTKIYFNLNDHSSKKAVLNAIRGLQHKGGKLRNTGAALKFVQEHLLKTSSGSRFLEKVPQILFLLTGGKSSDTVSSAAIDLKQGGALPFAIGMKNAEQGELQEIAFSSRFLFNLPEFGDLLSIQPEIAKFIQKDMQTELPSIVGKMHQI